MENKPVSLLVVFLGKTLNGMPPSYVADRWWGQAVYASWWPQSNRRLANRASALTQCGLYTHLLHKAHNKKFKRQRIRRRKWKAVESKSNKQKFITAESWKNAREEESK